MTHSEVRRAAGLRFSGDQLVVSEDNIAGIQFRPVGRLKVLHRTRIGMRAMRRLVLKYEEM
jgi:hypothetical protein